MRLLSATFAVKLGRSAVFIKIVRKRDHSSSTNEEFSVLSGNKRCRSACSPQREGPLPVTIAHIDKAPDVVIPALY
ncbi:hypothetical protein F4860DRAFT_514426 [Xylaria cubensis]|nr:hypothetical protein F4860DRAFT_514426 [Xylaria cubensis]